MKGVPTPPETGPHVPPGTRTWVLVARDGLVELTVLDDGSIALFRRHPIEGVAGTTIGLTQNETRALCALLIEHGYWTVPA